VQDHLQYFDGDLDHKLVTKKTEICQTCAKIKNVCQTCLLDLQYGLPVQVREATLPGSSSGSMLPVSDVNREWFAQQADAQLATGQHSLFKHQSASQLLKLARTAPYYKRNQAHVCSFFLKGECKRGAECPYRHEVQEENDLSHQNIKDRYYGKNDPVAKKLLTKMNAIGISPPDDKSIKTLYVANVVAEISEEDIREAFYSFGEITEVKLVPKTMCAFVTYSTREAAESAANKLFNNLVVKGTTLRIAWAKPTIHDSNIGSASETQSYFTLPTGSTPSFVPYVAPPNPQVSMPFYPSMNPQRLGSK